MKTMTGLKLKKIQELNQ